MNTLKNYTSNISLSTQRTQIKKFAKIGKIRYKQCSTSVSKSNSGFTMIEILVGINLSFIAITVMVSLFLFTTKYIATSLKHYDDELLLTTQLFYISTKLNRAESFIFTTNGAFPLLSTSNGLKLQFKENTIWLSDLDSLSGIDNYIFTIKQKNGDEKVIVKGELNSPNIFSYQETSVESPTVRSLNFDLIIDSQQYIINYYPKFNSIKHFQNLSDIYE